MPRVHAIIEPRRAAVVVVMVWVVLSLKELLWGEWSYRKFLIVTLGITRVSCMMKDVFLALFWTKFFLYRQNECHPRVYPLE